LRLEVVVREQGSGQRVAFVVVVVALLAGPVFLLVDR